MKAKLEDLNGFLKENKSKIGGFPPIGGRMESMKWSFELHFFPNPFFKSHCYTVCLQFGNFFEKYVMKKRLNLFFKNKKGD